MDKNSRTSAFTIVEVLVVIVVIGILAGILVVGYGSVVSNAHDQSVQSDLQKIDDAMKQYSLDNGGTYPQDTTQLTTLKLKVASGSYMTTNKANLYFCANATYTEYAVVAMSKSGKRFMIKSESGISEYTGGPTWNPTTANWTTTCSAADASYVPLTGNLTGLVDTTWSSWIQAQ